MVVITTRSYKPRRLQKEKRDTLGVYSRNSQNRQETILELRNCAIQKIGISDVQSLSEAIG